MTFIFLLLKLYFAWQDCKLSVTFKKPVYCSIGCNKNCSWTVLFLTRAVTSMILLSSKNRGEREGVPLRFAASVVLFRLLIFWVINCPAFLYSRTPLLPRRREKPLYFHCPDIQPKSSLSPPDFHTCITNAKDNRNKPAGAPALRSIPYDLALSL